MSTKRMPYFGHIFLIADLKSTVVDELRTEAEGFAQTPDLGLLMLKVIAKFEVIHQRAIE